MLRTTPINKGNLTSCHSFKSHGSHSSFYKSQNILHLHNLNFKKLHSTKTHLFSTTSSTTQDSKSKVIIIAGATGVGKTETGIKLAKQIDGEIICGDSVQLYNELNIGNWKISPRETNALNEVPHHLFDRLSVLHPEETYSASEYVSDARNKINEVLSRGKTPIVVGGSGFYQKSLIAGKTGGTQISSETWEKVKRILEEDNDWVKSLKRLEEMDPEHVPRIEFGDRYRLGRALGINIETGKNMKEFEIPSLNDMEFDYDFRTYFLYKSRVDLYRLVDVRCEEIVEQGLFEETGKYLEHLTPVTPIGRAIGYKDAFQFITQHGAPVSLDAFKNFLLDYKRATRNLVRAQMMWFRRSPYYPFINIDESPVEQITKLNKMSQDHWHAFAENKYLDKQEKEDSGIKSELREYQPELGQFRSPKLVEQVMNRINAVRVEVEENGQLEKALAKIK